MQFALETAERSGIHTESWRIIPESRLQPLPGIRASVLLHTKGVSRVLQEPQVNIFLPYHNFVRSDTTSPTQHNITSKYNAMSISNPNQRLHHTHFYFQFQKGGSRHLRSPSQCHIQPTTHFQTPRLTLRNALDSPLHTAPLIQIHPHFQPTTADARHRQGQMMQSEQTFIGRIFQKTPVS